MNIKDQIRAEIERRITDNTFGAKLELIDILAFLDSLPEQPEGLEDEMAEMWLEWCEDVDYLVYASIARHFAEWGAEHTKQKPELVQHPAIGYMYNADAGRGEQMKQAILALLKSDLIQVAGRGFTKTALIEWVETRPAEMKEDEE